MWGEQKLRAFKMAKSTLKTSIVKAMPDTSQEMILMTDASDIAISCSLLERD